MPFTTDLTDRLLASVRARRAESESRQGAPIRGLGKVACRVAVLADFAAVSDLKKRYGLGDDCYENWQRLWVHNPALSLWGEPPALGWVLQAGEKIVGFLGNIPLRYWYRGKAVRAVSTHALVVEPEYRAVAVKLVTAFLRQPNVDLLLNTTAVPAAGRLFTALGGKPVPQPNYGQALFWVVRPSRFADAVVRKLGLRGPVALFARTVGPVALAADRLARARVPRDGGGHCEIRQITVDELGADFLELWNSASSRESCLVADRSPEALRWHFSGPQTKPQITILVACSGKRLEGYVVLQSTRDSESGLRRAMVADLIVQDNAPSTIRLLLQHAYRWARAGGDDTLEMIGFPTFIRQIAMASRPYRRNFPACPYYFKCNDGALDAALAAESAWYACPFDGDASLGS